MNILTTSLPGVLLIEPKVFADSRGFFMESFNQRAFEQRIGEAVCFVQDNHSRSVKGVLRGLHYQLAPHAQGKLVRCVVGEVFDVAVDLRRHSPTFGQWSGHMLSAENRRQLWIPAGFAHGFLTLSDEAHLLYKTTDYYVPQAERTIAWDDPDLAIHWPTLAVPLQLSAKDTNAGSLQAAIRAIDADPHP